MRFILSKNKAAIGLAFVLALASCSKEEAPPTLQETLQKVPQNLPTSQETGQERVQTASEEADSVQGTKEAPSYGSGAISKAERLVHDLDGVTIKGDYRAFVWKTEMPGDQEQVKIIFSSTFLKGHVLLTNPAVDSERDRGSVEPVSIRAKIDLEDALSKLGSLIEPTFVYAIPLERRLPLERATYQIRVSVQPREGLTWGEVESEGDLWFKSDSIEKRVVPLAGVKAPFQPKTSEELGEILKSDQSFSPEDYSDFVSRAKAGDPVLISALRAGFLNEEGEEQKDLLRRRSRVLELMGRMGSEAALVDLRPQIEALVWNEGTSRSYQFSRNAISALGAINEGTQDEALIEKLKAIADFQPKEVMKREDMAVLVAIGRVGGPIAIETLSRVVLDADDFNYLPGSGYVGSFFIAAVEGLAASGPEAIPVLMKVYDHFETSPLFRVDDGRLRESAAAALVKAPEALEALKAIDEGDRHDVIDFLIQKMEGLLNALESTHEDARSSDAELTVLKRTEVAVRRMIGVLASTKHPRVKGVLEQLASAEGVSEKTSGKAALALLELNLAQDEKLEIALRYLESAEDRVAKFVFIDRLPELIRAFLEGDGPGMDLVVRTYDFLGLEVSDGIVANNRLGFDASEEPLVFYSSYYFYKLLDVFLALREVVDLDVLPDRCQKLDRWVFAARAAHSLLSTTYGDLKEIAEDIRTSKLD